MSKWPTVRLGGVATFERGLTYSKADEADFSSVVVLRANNVRLSDGQLDLSELRYLRDDFSVPESKVVSVNTLLVCTASGSKTHLGKVALVEEDLGFAFGGFMGKIESGPAVLPRFLYHSLRSEAYGSFIASVTDGANINNLKWSQLQEFAFTLPPIDEQKRIVARLDAAMHASGNLLDILNKQDKLAGTLTNSVATRAVADLTGPEVSLAEVASVDYGSRLTRKNDGGTKYPVYGGGGETFRTDSWNREDCYIVSRFAMSQECVRFVGGKFFLNDSGLSVATYDETVLQQDFLNAYLLAKSTEIYALGRGTAQHNLDVPAFKSMPIRVPTHAEQRRFIEKIEGLRQGSKRLNALHERKKSALCQLNRAIVNSHLQEPL